MQTFHRHVRALPAGCAALIALLFFSAAPALAQVKNPGPPSKDPAKALLFSAVVPGGGQLYAGERGQGLFLLLGSTAALAGGAVLSNFELDYDYTCSNGNCIDPDAYNPNYVPMVVGAGIAAALWFYGLVDAPGAARRANRKRERVASIAMTPTPVMRGGTLEPGLSMRITF